MVQELGGLFMKRPAAAPVHRPATKVKAKAKAKKAPSGAAVLAGEGARLAIASNHDKAGLDSGLLK